MKKRWLYRVLILLALAALAVWLEPTRVVWGWLRGEAFYQGRPTSWWRSEFGRWRLEHGYFKDKSLGTWRRPHDVLEKYWYRWVLRKWDNRTIIHLKLGPIHPENWAGDQVVRELARDPCPELHEKIMEIVRSKVAFDPTWSL
jgi:hypothetical protein